MPSESTRRPGTAPEPPIPATTAPPWATNLEATNHGPPCKYSRNHSCYSRVNDENSSKRRAFSRNIILGTRLCADSSPLIRLYLAKLLQNFWDRSPTPALKAWSFFVRAVILITRHAHKSRPWLKLSKPTNLTSNRYTLRTAATSVPRVKAVRRCPSAKW